jgi:GAF domain-containing protein
MPSFTVAVPGRSTAEVQAENWLVALGRALGADASAIGRLACEVQPNGTVIARDAAAGRTWVVMEVQDVEIEIPPLDDRDVRTLPPEALDEIPEDEEPDAQISRAATHELAAAVLLSIAEQMLGVESSAVILSMSGGLRFVAARGPHARRLTGLRMPPGSGVAGHVIERGQPVLVADARADARHYQEIDALTGYRTRQMIVVPIPGRDRVLGAVEVMNRANGARFESSDVARLSSLARSLGRRIDRAG